MSQENQRTNSAAPENLPVKRKRGRPRKDESLIHGEKASVTPGTDTVKRNRRQRTDSTTDTMVGQVVSGVLEGSFDAGYLLTVRVGDTNTVLRGVVFEPGLSVPISMENDVAPHVKMYKRTEIPLPVVDPPTHVPASTLQFKQKNERPVMFSQRNEVALPKASSPINQVPRTPQVSSSQLQPSPLATSKGDINDTDHVPQTAAQALQSAESKTKSSTSLLAKGPLGDAIQEVQVYLQAPASQIEKRKATDMLPNDETDLPARRESGNTNESPVVTPQKAVQSENKTVSSSATQPLPLEHGQTVKPTEVLQENEASELTKGPLINVDGPEDSSFDPKTKPSVEKLRGSETINQVAQVLLKVSEVELNNISVTEAPQPVATKPINEMIKMLQDRQTPSRGDGLQDIHSELSGKIPNKDETSNSNERSLNDVPESTGGNSRSEPKTNIPIEMVQSDTTPAALDGSVSEVVAIPVLPKVPEPQISSSNVPVQNEDGINKNADPSMQSQSDPAESNKNTDPVGA